MDCRSHGVRHGRAETPNCLLKDLLVVVNDLCKLQLAVILPEGPHLVLLLFVLKITLVL